MPTKLTELHARQRRDSLANLREKLNRLLVGIVLEFGIDCHHQDVVRPETDIDGRCIAQAAKKKSRRGQQHERQRHLHHHQRIAQACAANTAKQRGAVLERTHQVRPRCAQSWNQSEEQSRDQRQTEE